MGGWNDNGRDQQKYSVDYSTNGSTYTPLGSVDFNPTITGGRQSAIQVTFTDDAGPLAGGALITNLRFNLNTSPENGYAGLAEIAAIAVPEPSGAALLGFGAGILMLIRRRNA